MNDCVFRLSDAERATQLFRCSDASLSGGVGGRKKINWKMPDWKVDGALWRRLAVSQPWVLGFGFVSVISFVLNETVFFVVAPRTLSSVVTCLFMDVWGVRGCLERGMGGAGWTAPRQKEGAQSSEEKEKGFKMIWNNLRFVLCSCPGVYSWNQLSQDEMFCRLAGYFVPRRTIRLILPATALIF